MIPVGIGRIYGLIRSNAVIVSVPIEIAAVGTRMIEYGIQDDSDPTFFRLGNQSVQIIFRSKQRIDFQIVARIIPMIGICLKYWIEIKDSYSQ